MSIGDPLHVSKVAWKVARNACRVTCRGQIGSISTRLYTNKHFEVESRESQNLHKTNLPSPQLKGHPNQIPQPLLKAKSPAPKILQMIILTKSDECETLMLQITSVIGHLVNQGLNSDSKVMA
ncbi:hypothetical protein JTE90_024298 [Oedothorax gibbosus]|uniref:Uncharacterized protein n=1 Tax=Oedothorax gibbosus TaxID=931172 RepID=A0AAV6W009_9ARAC|nr:hypothetical protein JTE90_024298 [Oedothorax gibbosus]